jgi:hypothetical protein
MELTDSFKTLLIETAKSLKGSARRLFMARTVKELGRGGQQRAARELRWGRMTIRKGMHELDSGVMCVDAFALRGRKRAEVHLPNLLADMRAIVDSQSQADPQFRYNRLYTRLTAAEVRRQLIAQKGYEDAALPTAETIGTKLNALIGSRALAVYGDVDGSSAANNRLWSRTCIARLFRRSDTSSSARGCGGTRSVQLGDAGSVG